jgi:hypothetical protein
MYTITATLAGMQTASKKDVELALGTIPKVDLSMKLSQITERITVTAEAPIVDLTSSATATSIRAFDKLPKGRDFTSLVTQAAAANNDPKAGGITIDGASGSENKYIMDGVDTTEPRTGVPGKVLITDFIDEVQVKSAGYAAEYGGAVGGVINVITKTGTNNFSGSVGGYYTDRRWGGQVRPTLQFSVANPDVTEYHTYPRDRVRRPEPGFTLGGPILKDSLWFFAAYEPLIQNLDRTPEGFTRTYSQKFRRDNSVFNLSGNATSRLLYKFVVNNSGYETTNLVPGVDGRSNPDPSVYTGKNDKFTNWTASGYADFVANQAWFASARGGRFYNNYKQSGISTDPIVHFVRGSPSVFPEVPPALVKPQGFLSIPTNTATQKDAYTRDNVNLDLSWFPQFAGTHRLKGGMQVENLKNEVLSGEQNYRYRMYWNRVNPDHRQRHEQEPGLVPAG